MDRLEGSESWGEVGAPATPNLDFDGFAGPLDFLLRLARAQQINLTVLPLQAIVEQLARALERAPAKMPLGQKADWVVMASWILLLRSNLMLPREERAQQGAETEAGQLRDRLVALERVQALAGWLQCRPQLGQDVFARGVPEWQGPTIASSGTVDVIAFLWAAMELFDDPGEAAETETRYRPRDLEPYSVAHARARILQRLAESRAAQTLDRLLPEDAKGTASQSLRLAERRRRAAWSSTFIASLELAKQGDVTLTQDEFLLPVLVNLAVPDASSGGDQNTTLIVA